MARPDFDLDLLTGTFTFSNDNITITVATDSDLVPPDLSITVESVTIETPHHTVTLPITDFEVPQPVVDHVFDLLGP
jgi:hypothetical protein